MTQHYYVVVRRYEKLKMILNLRAVCVLTIFASFMAQCLAYPEQGRFLLNLTNDHVFDGVAKNLYNNTKLYVRVSCSGAESVTIGWVLRETNVNFCLNF